jgi:hypothetical protein
VESFVFYVLRGDRSFPEPNKPRNSNVSKILPVTTFRTIDLGGKKNSSPLFSRFCEEQRVFFDTPFGRYSGCRSIQSTTALAWLKNLGLRTGGSYQGSPLGVPQASPSTTPLGAESDRGVFQQTVRPLGSKIFAALSRFSLIYSVPITP